jgi:hypothetical protein
MLGNFAKMQLEATFDILRKCNHSPEIISITEKLVNKIVMSSFTDKNICEIRQQLIDLLDQSMLEQYN